MGLGLSIAKKIVDAHKGQIVVKNVNEAENGETQTTGTRFTVIIPRDLKTPEMQRQLWLEVDEEG